MSATFVNKGPDTLTATDAANVALTGHAALTVSPGAFVSVAITPEDSTITADQGTKTYALTGTDAYGNTGDATADSGFTIDSVACSANVCGSRTAGGYTVEGTDLDNSDSTGLTVLHGVATQLVVTTSPTSPSTADAMFTVKVTIEDAYGNTVNDGPHHNDLITLGLSGGNTSTFSGPSTATAADGVATFSGLAVRKVGTLYKFTATDSPLTAGDSSPFEITPGALHHFVWNSATQTAGNIALQKAGVAIDPSPYVTAYDQYNNIKTDLLSDPAFAHTFTNSPNGTAFVASIAWSDGVGTVTATPVTADLVGNQHFTVSQGGITAGGDFNHFKVNPNDAATTVFADAGLNGQPLDTKFNTPIYSVCLPSGGTDPCATSPTSTGVRVLVRDAYGNPVLPTVITLTAVGLPAFVGTPPAITATTSSGIADFGNQPKIATVGKNRQLTAHAPTGLDGTSNKFDVATDLKGCSGTKCENKGSTTGVNIYNLLQSTNGNFFVSGGTNVLLRTQFLAKPDFTGATATQACGTSTLVGSGSEAVPEGSGVTGTQPTTTMVIDISKESSSPVGSVPGAATSFNLCIGAIWMGSGSPTAAQTKWALDSKGKLTNAVLETLTDGTKVYWGRATVCTALSDPTMPCIAVRTKQAADVTTYMKSIDPTWTAAKTATIASDSDIVFIVRKKSPWDGKAGIYS